jgi:hypothetical protein
LTVEGFADVAFADVEDSALFHMLSLCFLDKDSGMLLAGQVAMNPKAEELKRRTFKFALAVIAFCRTLRETWEGRELSRISCSEPERASAPTTAPPAGRGRTRISSSR